MSIAALVDVLIELVKKTILWLIAIGLLTTLFMIMLARLEYENPGIQMSLTQGGILGGFFKFILDAINTVWDAIAGVL